MCHVYKKVERLIANPTFCRTALQSKIKVLTVTNIVTVGDFRQNLANLGKENPNESKKKKKRK